VANPSDILEELYMPLDSQKDMKVARRVKKADIGTQKGR
jgi:hypothetical protein